jgi:hypothetical protein
MGWWELYGSDLVQATNNARIVRRIAFCVAGFGLYAGFLMPIGQRRLAHAACLFLAYQLLAVVASLAVFGETLAEALPFPSLFVHVLIALAALIVTRRLGATRRSSRPNRHRKEEAA